MRIYDPTEELPPDGATVYALIEYCRSSIYPNDKIRSMEMVKFEYRKGWTGDWTSFEVLLWTDFQPPNLEAEWMARNRGLTSTSPRSDQDATEQD
jgi:hypothetical protein